ncbi:hypothetical protein L596_009584 [Steinernema carpocapsae]|uniref:C2H2-type domain-containing protein n=1 Tax=Steinernema carpocapsae TaxID=34508 RepID=A0A4U5PG28_STECR|nr:hypothetical protein L596_009584 [Steinernema carpocapsae]
MTLQMLLLQANAQWSVASILQQVNKSSSASLPSHNPVLQPLPTLNINPENAQEQPKRKFPCKICGSVLSRQFLLQTHMRIHTNEKPFQCKHCPKAFSDRSNFRTHEQTHSDEKRFTCRKCGAKFKVKVYLTRHVKKCDA